MAGTACLCCGERPAFFFSLLALTIITFHPQRYNKQVFLRESENIGVGYCEACRPTSLRFWRNRERASEPSLNSLVLTISLCLVL